VSFAAPLWLAAAALVAVGVVIAHLFSTSVPPRDLLPTVRFVPEGAPLAVLRTKRISDVALLLLRLLAVTLLGLGLAGAHVQRRGPSRVVLVDRSRAVASIAEVRDSVALLAGGGDAMAIAFDSSARRVSRDSLTALMTTQARGSLSAALVAAHRALAAFDDRSKTELVVVSPLASEEVDSATVRLLALWEGTVRVVRVAAAAAPLASGSTVRAEGDDPVAAVIPTSSQVIPSAARDLQVNVRVVRTLPTPDDSAWARDSGGVLVLWPAADGVLERRERPDTQSGIAAMGGVVVAAFARPAQPREGRVLARWLDGEPAATERSLGQGCVREVAISVDAIGDVALRESFRALVGSLLEPCGGARDFTPYVIPSAGTRDSGWRNLRLATAGPSLRSGRQEVAIWLAALALVVLIAEQFLRARRRASA
jgi:hypothetical protein